LLPSLEFEGWMAVTPLVNIVMLARDMLEGSVNGGLAVAAVCSTIFYIGAAIALAARIFGTDAILYGSPATWSDLVRRPREPQRAASLAAAMLCLAVMFPAFFILANTLGRSPELSMERQFVVRAIITAAIFGGIPAAIALAGHVSFSSGLGLRAVNFVSVLAGVVLGLSLWPAAHELTLYLKIHEWITLNPEMLAKLEEMVSQFRALPLWLILVTFALVPAVFEELCFRGFLFAALRQRVSGTWTVILTALLFGFFHEVLSPGKLMTTTALGLVLGWVRLRSGSVLPGTIAHAVHNGFLFSIIYYEKELAARGWGVQEETHLPLAWHALAAGGILLGVGMLMVATRKRTDRDKA
jgi:ABC-2 type transport system permease protein/sodium transport system permease protein